MSAQKYRDRIRFERKMPPPGDPAGADYDPGAEEWVPFCEAWAEVQDVMPSKSEAVQNGLRLAKDSARVRIRYRTGIDADMRIVELGRRKRTLSIVSGPAVLGGYRELEFMVEGYSS